MVEQRVLSWWNSASFLGGTGRRFLVEQGILSWWNMASLLGELGRPLKHTPPLVLNQKWEALPPIPPFGNDLAKGLSS
jgi:hypothetical protein